MSLSEILEKTKGSLIISDAFTKADSILNHKGYKNIACSVSGGADSDVMIDICEKVKPHEVHYVWFDTGIEYQATKEHLGKKWRKESMKYEVNECCDCATESYPCIGDSCSLRHVTYYRCDRCGCDGLTEDEIHEVDGEDLCDTCYDEEFPEEGEEHD